MTCLLAENIPCVSVDVVDIGRFDFTLDLDAGETIASATVTEPSGEIAITNAQANTGPYFDSNTKREVSAGKAVEWNYSNPGGTPGTYTFSVTAVTSLGRSIPYDAQLEMI